MEKVIGKQNRASRWILIAVVSLFCIGQLFPLIWLLDFSLAKNSDLFGAYILVWPDPPQWQNYVVAWIQGKIPRYMFNSTFVTTTVIFLVCFLSLTLGYAFTRMQWKGRKIFLTIILLGMMIPIHATLLPNFFTFRIVGILDTYLGLIIPYVARSMPIGVFLMTGFLASIPKSLEESAVIDGAGIYTIIYKIIFPLTKPAIVTISVITFINSWNEFIMALTYLSTDNLRTLPFSVMNFAGQYSSDYSKQFAVMALSALPAFVIYIILNEQITKGVMLGAVKG